MTDVTIHIKVKQPDTPSEPSLAPAEEEEEEGEQQLPQAKRARTEDGGGEVDDSAAAVAGDGVVATIQAHAAVLVQLSAFFRAMLMGAGSGMLEGRMRVITVEFESEEGGSCREGTGNVPPTSS